MFNTTCGSHIPNGRQRVLKGQDGMGCNSYRKVHEYEESKIGSEVPLVCGSGGRSISMLYLLPGAG